MIRIKKSAHCSDMTRYPEPDGIDADGGIGPGPRRRPQQLRRKAPGTAANRATVAVWRDPWLPFCGSTSVESMVTIVQPLEYVAVHLIKAPRIGRKTINWQRLSPKYSLRSAVVWVAVIVGILGRDRCAPPERRACPSASHILALGLARQAIALAGLAREPRNIRFGIIKADAYHRMRPALLEPWCALGEARSFRAAVGVLRTVAPCGKMIARFGDEAVELIDGDGELSNPERPSQHHSVL